MNNVDHEHRLAVRAEACAWISRLDARQPSQEDLLEFRDWMGRSPTHLEEVKLVSDVWTHLNDLTELAVPMRQPPRVAPVWYALAASVLVAVVFFGFWQSSPLSSNPDVVTYRSDVGERRNVGLSDGTAVLLNTDSELRVEYTGATRGVRVVRGEAYFDVKPDSARPFVVSAGNKTIRAVGTAFLVYLRDRDVEVVVSHGTVALSQAGDGDAESALVTAGQQATADEKSVIRSDMPIKEISRRLSWRDGVLDLSDESLEHVVREVSRYTPARIEIIDPAIRDLRVGGYVKTDDTSAFFEMLESSSGVRVAYVGDDLIQLSAK